MDEQDRRKVIEFPLHRRGSLADTMSGFPEREGGPAWRGSRREETISVLVADLRGHPKLAERRGGPTADADVAAALTAAVDVVRTSGGGNMAVGGGRTQPVLGAEFAGEGHAAAALTAAVHVREVVARVAGGLSACAGVNTGSVAETTIGDATRVAYRAIGTLRMFAVRLQEFAGPGDVYVAASTVAALPRRTATFRSIGPVRTNAGGETSEAFCLLELVRPAGAASPARATGSG